MGCGVSKAVDSRHLRLSRTALHSVASAPAVWTFAFQPFWTRPFADRPRCAPRHQRPPQRATAAVSRPTYHRLRPTAARAPRPTFRARAAAGRGDVPRCCHHDAANYSYDLLLLTAVIVYVLTNDRKPSAMIFAHFCSCRREHGRRAPDGHLQAAGAQRNRHQSRRGEAPRLAAERVLEACRQAE